MEQADLRLWCDGSGQGPFGWFTGGLAHGCWKHLKLRLMPRFGGILRDTKDQKFRKWDKLICMYVGLSEIYAFLPWRSAKRSLRVFDVKWQREGLWGSTCAQTVAAGQQEGGRKTVSEYLQSASAKMMLGLFPPSSSVTLFRLLFPAASWISLPTCGERGEPL